MDLASRTYQEKRNFIRMKVETPVDISLDRERNMRGTCHNLSGGGMLISLPEPLPLGTQMEAVVSSNHGHHPMLKALVQVCRIHARPASETTPCRLGLEIVSLLE